uniref:Uncharacterized protein n=1 Tax=Amphimedon queenslandica TaxID=400682 RepID=A0A1X7VFZ5_AMPQE
MLADSTLPDDPRSICTLKSLISKKPFALMTNIFPTFPNLAPVISGLEKLTEPESMTVQVNGEFGISTPSHLTLITVLPHFCGT